MTTSRDYEHGFLPQADALAYGMTTALRRGFNGKQPRTRYTSVAKREGTSANVLVYNRNTPERTPRVVPASAFKITVRAPRVNNTAQAARQERYTITCADMAPIGNID